jgi:hypothetical protein
VTIRTRFAPSPTGYLHVGGGLAFRGFHLSQEYTMPYFVFRVSADKQLKLVKTCEKYKEAKDLCRELRKSESPDNPNAICMAFAENEIKAKHLLTKKRQPSSPLEEWEA